MTNAEQMKKKFLLRISPELWEELNRWADQEFRSVNSQIEFVLRDAVQRRNRNAKVDDPNLNGNGGDPL